MCVILVGKVKDILALDLASAWQCNPDGAGIAVPGKTPAIHKGFMTLKSLKSRIESIKVSHDIAVHFRMATHGAVNQYNTHPFMVDNGTVLMHNGVLSGLGASGSKGRSDSAHLASILSKLPQSDRLPLIQSVGGKYALVDHKITLIGGFEKKHSVFMSNTHWQGYSANRWSSLYPQSVYRGPGKTIKPADKTPEIEPRAVVRGFSFDDDMSENPYGDFRVMD